LRDAVDRFSRFSARLTDRARRADRGLPPCTPARLAALALSLVVRFALRGGGGNLTPERRAFDNPIAIACLVERAPCLPSRTWWTSSRTNSPACVLGALPCRLSRRARASVDFSGMRLPP